MKYKDWDECIHIHACRRLTKIANNALFGKGKKGKLTRMCGKDRCDCFQSKDEIKETSRLVCELKDRIKWIKFNFGVPEEAAGIDASEEMKAMISGLNRLGRMMGAEKGQYMYNASEAGTLHVDQAQEDMTQVIHYCSTNAYDISVGFRYYGVYRYGREERAFAQLEDKVMDDFIHEHPSTDSEGNPVWDLHLWLDNMRRMYEDYRDVTPTKKKRKRKSKKQVA